MARIVWRAVYVRRSGHRLLDVLHLFAQLLDRHLHVDRDRRHLERWRFRAERVGLAQQLLDDELEALADLAALVEQARDLVEVGAQARKLLGDVDADRIGRRFVERALLDRLARDRLRGAGLVERFLPELEKALLHAADGAGHERLGRVGEAAQMGDTLGEDDREPLAFAGARGGEALDTELGGLQHGVLGLRLGGAAAPLQRLVDREGARVRQVLAHAGVDAREVGQLLGRRVRHDPFGERRAGDSKLDLAALEARGEHRPQRRLEAAQLVREAHRDVEKAAVDGSDLDRERWLWRRATRRFVQCCRSRCRRSRRGIRVAGHAVNCHAHLLLFPVDYVKAKTRAIAIRHGRGRLPGHQETGGRWIRRGLPLRGQRTEARRPERVSAVVARRALARGADAPCEARKAAALPTRPEELFRRRPIARPDIAHERRLGAQFLPRERNRLHGDELPAGRYPAGCLLYT